MVESDHVAALVDLLRRHQKPLGPFRSRPNSGFVQKALLGLVHNPPSQGRQLAGELPSETGCGEMVSAPQSVLEHLSPLGNASNNKVEKVRTRVPRAYTIDMLTLYDQF